MCFIDKEIFRWSRHRRNCKNKKSDFRAILRVRFSLCLYLIILTPPPQKKNRELKIKVPMKWMNKRRWGTKCIKLCTEPNTHIMNYYLPVTSNCISSEVLVYCILYLCRFCKLFLSPSMIYWWPQCKHHILVSATWPGGPGNLFNNFTYTTSFGAGVYSFWFVELWLGFDKNITLVFYS